MGGGSRRGGKVLTILKCVCVGGGEVVQKVFK